MIGWSKHELRLGFAAWVATTQNAMNNHSVVQLGEGVIQRMGAPAAGSLFPRRRGHFECELSIE